jgi:hypothetical protein
MSASSVMVERLSSAAAEGSLLEGNAKGLPTFGQRRLSAKIGGVRSHQSESL